MLQTGSGYARATARPSSRGYAVFRCFVIGRTERNERDGHGHAVGVDDGLRSDSRGPSRGSRQLAPGNLVCALDPDTGTIRTARTKDAFGTTDHESHPVTGAPLVGETLPMWDRVLDLARTCAPIFSPIRYQSMDIAITPAGPMLIEINTGGSFTLPQFASGRGFLTDEVREFFRECGYAKV